jgi:hypothetical protein
LTTRTRIPIVTFVFSCLFLLGTIPLNAQIITIGTDGDYPTLEAAESFIEPGDTLLMQSQVFSNGAQFLSNLVGTSDAPIVILAENEHQSIFRGGTEAIHLINCSFLEINGLVIEQQTGNGINIDDGGDYNTPSKHITLRNCIFRDMAANGNNDLLKMSGVDSFLIENCQFVNGGGGGSGIDFVGCHWGTIQDCYFDDPGTSGIQNKGGTQYIRIQRNTFKNVAQRALNLGGSTGLQFFRPPLGNPIQNAFEAADIEVFANVFVGSWSPIAYVGAVRVKVYNNSFYQPENWVIRILQETTTPGFLTCANNEFSNNIVYLENDLTEVNIGPNTDAGSFTFSNNLWFNETSSSWTPNLPVTDVNQLIENPEFEDQDNEDFRIPKTSPAVGAGIDLGVSFDFAQIAYLDPPSIGAFEGGEMVTAIFEIKSEILHIYPNPASKSLFVLNPNGKLIDGQFTIYNSFGNLLKKGQIINEKIDIADVNEGVFFLRISLKDGMVETKMISIIR